MTHPAPIEVGARLPTVSTGPVLRHHLVEWCAAENDYYNIHYDERAAFDMGLAGSPIQGTYKYALFSRVVEDWLARRGRIVAISAIYRRADFEGASLLIDGTVLSREGRDLTVELLMTNQAGETTTSGLARIELLAGFSFRCR